MQAHDFTRFKITASVLSLNYTMLNVHKAIKIKQVLDEILVPLDKGGLENF